MGAAASFFSADGARWIARRSTAAVSSSAASNASMSSSSSGAGFVKSRSSTSSNVRAPRMAFSTICLRCASEISVVFTSTMRRAGGVHASWRRSGTNCEPGREEDLHGEARVRNLRPDQEQAAFDHDFVDRDGQRQALEAKGAAEERHTLVCPVCAAVVRAVVLGVLVHIDVLLFLLVLFVVHIISLIIWFLLKRERLEKQARADR